MILTILSNATSTAEAIQHEILNDDDHKGKDLEKQAYSIFQNHVLAFLKKGIDR
jgi:hypothetical protein